MEYISHLMTCAIETNVFKRFSLAERVNPKRKYSLVRLAKLTGSSKHTALIDLLGNQHSPYSKSGFEASLDTIKRGRSGKSSEFQTSGSTNITIL